MMPDERTHCMRLQYPPLYYVLMSMNYTKATALDGLEQGVLPVGGTADKDVRRDHPNEKRTSISRQQLPH